MANTSFRFKLTLKDIWAIFFRKKICPNCQQKLSLKITKIPRGIDYDPTFNLQGVKVETIEHFNVYAEYYCTSCGTKLLARNL